jgi:hypothetical protein
MLKRFAAALVIAALVVGLCPALSPLTASAEEYPTPTEVLVPSTTADTATINLTVEAITISGMTVAAFSVDGGRKWRRGALPTEQRRISALFNKPLELWVSDQKLENGKPITKATDIDESKVIKFPAVEARPKRVIENGKPMIWYAFDPDTNTASWNITSNRDTARKPILNTFEVAEAVGKTPVTYAMFTESTDMAQKTYFVRTPANNDGGKFTPASRAARVKTAKPTKDITLRERNGAVQLRKGWTYRIIKGNTPDAPIALTAKESVAFDTYSSIEVWTTPGRRPASKVAVNGKGTWEKSDGGDDPDVPFVAAVTHTRDFDGILLTVELEKEVYRVGDIINIRTTLKNNRDEAVAMLADRTHGIDRIHDAAILKDSDIALARQVGSFTCCGPIVNLPSAIVSLNPNEECVQYFKSATFYRDWNSLDTERIYTAPGTHVGLAGFALYIGDDVPNWDGQSDLESSFFDFEVEILPAASTLPDPNQSAKCPLCGWKA